MVSTGLKQAAKFAKDIGLRFPAIIQAPMAGGITTPKLVSAVSNAGALGSFATGYLKADEVIAGIKAIKSMTQNPFCVNLFIPSNYLDSDLETIRNYQRRLNLFRKELGLKLADEEEEITIPEDNFSEIAEILLNEDIKIVSFVFGTLPEKYLEAFKARKIYLIGTATTPKEAIILQESGVDAIIAQGYEAGGHRGGFTTNVSRSMIGMMSLIPSIANKIDKPLIAAGGIMDARGIVSAITLGACAVQMGTSFLNVAESGANEVYKATLKEASKSIQDCTAITSSYSGKPARGIETKFMQEMKNEKTPDYPIAHYLTQIIRREAARQKNPELMSLWCGQGISTIGESNEPVARRLEKIWQEAEKIFEEYRSYQR